MRRIFLLYRHPSSFVLPLVYSLMLFPYHSYRTDREFLPTYLKHTERILTSEYLLYSCPFVLLTLFREDWIVSLFYIGYAILLPYVPALRFRYIRLPLSFLSPGSYEYARGMRRYILLYVFLFLISCIGGLYHHNLQILRFCILFWGICMWDFSCFRCMRTTGSLTGHSASYGSTSSQVSWSIPPLCMFLT